MADGVSLAVEVDTASALAALKDFAEQAKESSSHVKESLEGIKAVGEAALAFFAVEKVAEFYGEAIAKAAEQEQGLNRLATAMKLTGEYSETATKDFEEFAQTMETTTKFSDDQVVSQLAVAKSFGLTNEQAKELVKSSAALASATGESLDTAVHQLGITYSGTAGRLQKTIPILADLTAEQLKNGDAIKLVGDRFAGSAENEIKTYSGAILQVGNAFEEIQKELGQTVVKNEVVIAALGAVKDAFRGIAEFVSQNKDAISNVVRTAVEVIATSLPVALDILGFFTKGLEGLVNVGGLAFGGLTEIASVFAEAFGAILQIAGDTLIDFLSTLTDVAADSPILSKGLDLIGISAQDLSKDLGETKDAFDNSIAANVDSVDEFRDSVTGGMVDINESFETFNNGFDVVTKAVEDGVQKIFDADKRIKPAAEEAAEAQADFVRKTGASAKDLAKLKDDFAKFSKGLLNDEADDVEKLILKRDEEYKKLAEFEHAGVVSHQEAAKLREGISESSAVKIGEILDAAQQKAFEDVKKRAEELKASVTSAASSPFEFAVKQFKIEPAALTDFQSQLAGASAGLLGNLLKGKSGAADAISSLGGAVADAFVPGLGAAVGPILGVLQKGPDATKAMIKQFIEAVPDLITAIAESIPVVVSTLVTSLITQGGIIKIAVALVEGVLSFIPAIGKALGINLGSSFNGAEIGRTISGAFKATMPDFGAAGKALSQAFIAPVQDLFKGNITKALTDAFMAPLNLFKSVLPASLRAPFEEFEEKLKALFIQSLQPLITAFNYLKTFATDIRNIFSSLTTNFYSLFNGFTDSFYKLFNFLSSSLTDLFNFLPDAISKIFGGGGGGGGELGKIAKGHFASGITEIPAGYPNDSFHAGLQSGERVVDSDANADLKSFLKDYKAGDGTGGGNDAVLAMLTRIASLLAAPVQTVAQLKLGGQAFGDAILDQTRRNARLY